MGFMDKLKQTATSAKDSMKKSFDETSAAMKAHNEESKELKKALDGAIARYEVTYVKRTISTTEVLLGGGDSANQEQENVICILYTSQDNKKLTLRVEMLTGTTIFNQAAKCREFMDLLRQYDIFDKFDSKDNKTDTSSDGNDVFAQLEKLQKLKEAGILTDEEFNLKKQELLNKM